MAAPKKRKKKADAEKAPMLDADESESRGPQVIEIRPMAKPSSLRKRHWGLALSFLLMVAAPIGATAWYLWDRAVDEYSSTTGFTVRTEETQSGTALLGGLTSFVGGGSSSGDSQVIYEFVQSQDLAERINKKLDLVDHYSATWSRDPFFSLKPDGTIEDLRDYWQKVVRVSFNGSSGLTNVEVHAFTPEMAQAIAKEILSESQKLVNQLNATARADSLKYTQEDVNDAVARLKDAREAMVNFRTRTQIVDPQSDLQGRMGVLNGLQQQLAQALINYDLLVQEAAPNDPRIIQAKRRIDVTRQRIADERANIATNNNTAGLEAYPKLLSEYESLSVDQQFAEESYRAALSALDLARSNAARQTRYLAVYQQPTLPEAAEYPRRWSLLGLTSLFAFLIWTILSLTFYSLRDRR